LLGDAIVHYSSENLLDFGVPNYCTYNIHASGLSSLWTGSSISSSLPYYEDPSTIQMVEELLLKGLTQGVPCTLLEGTK